MPRPGGFTRWRIPWRSGIPGCLAGYGRIARRPRRVCRETQAQQHGVAHVIIAGRDPLQFSRLEGGDGGSGDERHPVGGAGGDSRLATDDAHEIQGVGR
jgi:hypothetical protein